MNSGLNKTRLPLLPQLALQHLSQWETLPGQTSFKKGGEMCCRVTRSDVICVYFQHIHVNVDTWTPPRRHTCKEQVSHMLFFTCTDVSIDKLKRTNWLRLGVSAADTFLQAGCL